VTPVAAQFLLRIACFCTLALARADAFSAKGPIVVEADPRVRPDQSECIGPVTLAARLDRRVGPGVEWGMMIIRGKKG
jgi:hypothetical protein